MTDHQKAIIAWLGTAVAVGILMLFVREQPGPLLVLVAVFYLVLIVGPYLIFQRLPHPGYGIATFIASLFPVVTVLGFGAVNALSLLFLVMTVAGFGLAYLMLVVKKKKNPKTSPSQ